MKQKSNTSLIQMGKGIRKNTILYVFLLPALLYIFLFNYAPLYGIQIAFKEFTPYLGIWNSPWIGFNNFMQFFKSIQFWKLLSNTLTISLYSLLAGFPIPILLAILINYIEVKFIRRITQTITYIPNFISIVVMVGMMMVLLSPRNGAINLIINALGGDSVNFFARPDLFRHLYVWSGIWQNAGFASVIYIAVLASVSPEHHEAAIVDGANKLQRIIHIDIPSILPTAIILLILNMGHIMSVGFEKVFLMQNAINLEVSEIISTYVYKMGIQNARYSFSAAIGLFNNIINFLILVIVNKMAGKFTETSLW